MYNIQLKINLLDIFDINIAESTISWIQKAELVRIVNTYIKQNKLIEIVKNYGGYNITWNNRDSFDNFVSEDVYLSIVTELEELGVSISWKE